MKINFKKIKMNQVLLIISIIIVSLWLINRAREKYDEGQIGPAIGPAIEETAKAKKMTQAELDAVLKFIK
ncbi:hypothetical protein AP053_gp058 [Ostreococcus mediterraneus virus 1]|uniref:hypothetical protein n=1 Tax=Ostreococcus mediterraneus virus 1 TaxID=1663210 RepID=UPI0006D0B359|nr:hypothetical protein AP053_gp058 [Ostreococcus mediterraneus virus 1]ALI95169.1 hypothetical protein OmV1_058c [Ostreococcus mediterraneus virus 1]